jgi:hypothetical protein
MPVTCIRFKPPPKNLQEEWKRIIDQFRHNQDYEKAYEAWTSMEEVKTFLQSKSKSQLINIKEHVSSLFDASQHVVKWR